ncbi:DUF1573 domain-containing protein [Pedobacter psychroterrae]|uniref:DUF1573 domain-containing protein n=1 Tax=Pedobacter psychroterrae TaxID=2530453 RepID=A0A4R0NK02_9SPHI|nr:DUF1573 domain-containing protein [Pedobacter psychroterrae]TCD01031.1 DUF1573 domain-containing protein [Pedobacter psychroterrae]
MKKAIMLFALILGISVAVNAQVKPAEFKFEKETFDFGSIPLNKPATVEFKFTNIGDQPLIISKVESTCGCTVPEYTQTPVKKGGMGTIKVTYNPGATPLPFVKAITISSNAKTTTKVLYIKGTTVAAADKSDTSTK